MYGSIESGIVREAGLVRPLRRDRPVAGRADVDLTRGARILVVDEDAGSRSSLVSALRAAGHRVEEAVSALALLERDGDRPPETVVAVIRDRSVTLEALTGLVERGWGATLIVVEGTADQVVRMRIRRLEPRLVVGADELDRIREVVSVHA